MQGLESQIEHTFRFSTVIISIQYEKVCNRKKKDCFRLVCGSKQFLQ